MNPGWKNVSPSPLSSIFMSGNVMTPHHINPADPFEFYEMADKEPRINMLEDKYKRVTFFHATGSCSGPNSYR